MRRVGFVLAAAFFLDVVVPGLAGRAGRRRSAALLLLTFALSRGADFESVSAAAATLLGAVYLGRARRHDRRAARAAAGRAGAVADRAAAGRDHGLRHASAFFVGHAFGRRRLAPAVSPGKSVEGALGGLAGGVLGAFVVRHLGLPELPAAARARSSARVVAAMGIVGDLDESLLKRWAGVKDSGALFPGHGGMLDRLDSLLFGAPVLYYYFQYVR